MATENTLENETVVDHKTALIQKAVILGAAAVGILISVGIKLPRVTVDSDEPITVAGDSDETPQS